MRGYICREREGALYVSEGGEVFTVMGISLLSLQGMEEVPQVSIRHVFQYNHYLWELTIIRKLQIGYMFPFLYRISHSDHSM